MLVYDTTATSWVAANGGMAAFSQDTVNRMNQAMQNSTLNHSFRLVHSMSVNYTTTSDGSSSLSSDLDTLQSNTGVFAAVHTARNTYSADLVAMLVDTGSASGYVGTGYLLTAWVGVPDYGFTVNAIRAVETGHTLTHEVGHNLGAHHAKNQISAPGPNTYLDNQYSAGWYFIGNNSIQYHTIMAYNADGYGNFYQEAPLFSTPQVFYQGIRSGDAQDGDNARLINQTIATVAAYRDSGVTLSAITISGPTSVNENSTTSYTATATWSDGSTSTVTPTWSENSAYTTINTAGILTASSVPSNQPVTIGASYTSGGLTRTDTHTVTVVNIPTTLSAIRISGPTSVNENSTASYTATATWSDGSTSTVTPTWSENSAYTTISTAGVLSTSSVPSNQPVTISASYTSGGLTRTDTHTVTVVNLSEQPKFPWPMFLQAITNNAQQ